MSDFQKAEFLLKLLSAQKLTLNGAKEAFAFTESYKWLIALTKKMQEEQVKNADK